MIVLRIKIYTFAPAYKVKPSGFSAVGSAHVWGARGRWFESSNPDGMKEADNLMVISLFRFFYFAILQCHPPGPPPG